MRLLPSGGGTAVVAAAEAGTNFPLLLPLSFPLPGTGSEAISSLPWLGQ